MDKKEFVRIKAKKYDGFVEPETKRFSIDPELTTFKILRETLSKAFNIKEDYVISYLVPQRSLGDDARFLPMLSDWDLNTAIYGASDPQLVIKVDLKPFDSGLEEWDIIEADDVTQIERRLEEMNNVGALNPVKSVAERLLGIGTKSQGYRKKQPAVRHAMNDSHFRAFLDAEGRLLNQQRFRLTVYQGGVEPSLRAVVWRHLLDVYPVNLTGKERIKYTTVLADKYHCLKDCWQRMLRNGNSETEELRLVANAVRKDVLRTDRHHAFFAGSDENANVLALFNLLTTYAMCHPEVAYCQGMSDLAAPLLFVMQDEAQAYICFCALMRRVRRNFLCDGWAMTKKFQHLSELLQYYDPVFYEYLRENHAEDLLFCYRWLLLELKREFTFDEALHVMEVTWASLPPDPPITEHLPIFEVDLTAHWGSCTPFSPGLHMPTMNNLLHLYSNSAEESHSDDTSDKSPPPSPSSLISEQENTLMDDDTDGFPFPFSDSEISIFFHESVSECLDSVPQELCTSFATANIASIASSVPVDVPIIANVSSCPSNLSGFCHSALVRQLMLGNGKSCESELHCHKTSSCSQPCAVLSDGESLSACTESTDDLHVLGRVIKQSNEETVTDKCSPQSSHTNQGSPIPMADDAEQAIKYSKQLTLDDVYDICVGQITVTQPTNKSSRSSALRTRQTSGETLSVSSSNQKNDDSKIQNEGTKSRHASSSQRTTLPDSGYSGTCTPYMHSIEVLNTQPNTNSNTQSNNSRRASFLTQDLREKERGSLEIVNVEKDPNVLLPPPDELGDGNPFVILLCLTLLLDHRDKIINNHMDFNEIAIHFDKLARKHSADKILHNARTLYANYLKSGWFTKRLN